MKRISVFVVGLALMVAESALAQAGLPVTPPALPPVPTVPAIEPQVPKVDVPELPSLPPVLPVPSADGPSSPGTAGARSTPAPRPVAAPTQRAGSRGGGAAVGGTSGAVRRSTVAGTSPSAWQTAGGGRAAARVQAGRDEPRVVRRERRLRDTVRRFRGCLDGLAPLERRVLVLRAGLGEERTRTRARVARLLDLSARRVRRVERSGLRRLRALGRSGACGAVPPVGGGASAPASVAAAPLLWTTPPGDLAAPVLDRAEVEGEQESSAPEPALAPLPKAVVPPAGAAVERMRNGAGIDLTIPMLAVLGLAAIAFAARSTRKSLRSY